MVSTSSLPHIVISLEQKYSYKSVTNQIRHNSELALFPHTGKNPSKQPILNHVTKGSGQKEHISMTKAKTGTLYL